MFRLVADRRVRDAVTWALAAMLLLMTIAVSYVHVMKASKQQEAWRLAQNFALRLAQRVNETASPVYMLAAAVHHNHGVVADFEGLAADLINEFPMARAIELAPAGVVQHVYPLRGNESIIGHDLLKDKGRNQEAHVALSKRQLTLAGPFELIQGGVGVVARYPVFLTNAQGRESFWGFSIVLMHVRELLANAGESEFARHGFSYRLCRAAPGAEVSNCRVFAKSSEGELDAPVELSVTLPNNQWILSVAPEKGWVSRSDWLVVLLVILLGGILVGFSRFFLHQRASTGDQPAADSGAV